jgi:hypothetical protein
MRATSREAKRVSPVYVFTQDGKIKAGAHGFGHPALDGGGIALSCEGKTLRGSTNRMRSNLTIETVMANDVIFATAYYFYSMTTKPCPPHLNVPTLAHPLLPASFGLVDAAPAPSEAED